MPTKKKRRKHKYIDKPYDDRVADTFTELFKVGCDVEWAKAIATHIVNLETRLEAMGVKWWLEDDGDE